MFEFNNKRNFYNLLFNVNQIYVEPELIDEYIKFSHKLNNYLFTKYSRYYAGLQLYQSKEDKCQFTVIAAYYNIPNICEYASQIGAEIASIYEYVWGDNVSRESSFYFCDAKRII